MRRGVGLGCGLALGAGVVGAAIGWFFIGPRTNDPELNALIGGFLGTVIGFATGGPAGSAFVMGAAAMGTLLGSVIGDFLTQDEGLGAVGGMFKGAGIGLLLGIAVGVAAVAATPDIEGDSSPEKRR